MLPCCSSNCGLEPLGKACQLLWSSYFSSLTFLSALRWLWFSFEVKSWWLSTLVFLGWLKELIFAYLGTCWYAGGRWTCCIANLKNLWLWLGLSLHPYTCRPVSLEPPSSKLEVLEFSDFFKRFSPWIIFESRTWTVFVTVEQELWTCSQPYLFPADYWIEAASLLCKTILSSSFSCSFKMTWGEKSRLI